MMRGRSPPKHRHDGTSPLPMGMDWSPPPKKWDGRDTVWPHDPHSGWSYCVKVPSWVALPKSRSSASDPVVFYRVLVGIQSPAGVTTSRGVLRRFNDFLKLFSDLKQAFPKKNLPSTPPKGLLRMKSRALLEQRRCSLEEWISKTLSDIDMSRSMAVASFLELEAAARSSFREASQPPSEANPSTIFSDLNHSSSNLPALAGSSSIASDYGSDTAYETSELGSPSYGRDDVSEVGLEELSLDEDLTSPMEKIAKYSMSNIDEGLLMGESILDQLESFKKHKVQNRPITDNGSVFKSGNLVVNRAGSSYESVPVKVVNHVRKPSNESVGSDLNLQRGEMSNSWCPNLLSEASLDLPSEAEASRTMGSTSSSELQYGVGDVVLPRDQQPKLDRILLIMQRRLGTAKTDLEDLITRLNQEVAVKEYLTTKVKDLEVELETTKEKSKENLQQALSLEKERVTKMQWDMEELRRKSLEYELLLKSVEGTKLAADPMRLSAFLEKDEWFQELDATKDQLNILLKKHEELEVKSKSDIKVLVKEVKSLRRSQIELKQKLDESVQEKIELEILLQQQRERSEHALAAKRELLHDCQTLQSRLLKCNINIVDNNFAADSSSSISDILDLLADSDKQISLLLEETQQMDRETNTLSSCEDLKTLHHEMRIVLSDIFLYNVNLRKQMNIIIRSALQTDSSTSDNGKQGLTRETILKQLFET